MIHHFPRITRSLIFWLIVLAAVFSTVLRIILPGIETYKSELEARISGVLEVPVTIGTMRASMHGFNPELILKDIEISAIKGRKPEITLKEIRLGIDVMEVLLDQDFFSATMVTLIGAKIAVIRKQDGTLSIRGLKASSSQPTWLLEGGRYEMLDSTVSWQDQKRHGEVVHFSHVDFFIDNNFGIKDHQINIHVKQDEALGGNLRLSMVFNGNMFVSGDIDAQLYVEGEHINLAKLLTGDWPLGLRIDTGDSDFKLWSEWKNTRMVSLLGSVKTRKVRVKLPTDEKVLLERMTAFFRWRQGNDDDWQLDVRRFNLEMGARKWPAANFSFWAREGGNQQLLELGAHILHLDINEVCDLLLLTGQMDADRVQVLKQSDPQGQIKDFLLFTHLDKNQVAVNGRLEDVHVAAVNNIPEIKHFSGYVKGTDQQGYIKLLVNESEIEFPGLFRNPLNIEKLTGKINWLQTAQHWILSSNMLEIDTPDIQTRNRIKIKIPKQEGNIFMDYQIYFFNGRNAAIAKKYFPVGVMDKDIVDWLDQAFYAGNISEGKGIFYGDLVDYPFSDGQGVFEVIFNAESGDVNFAPGWPRVYDVNAEIRFFRESLQITFKHAHINGAQITHAVGSVESLFKPSEHFLLKGEVQGSIGQAMAFMYQSPLADEASKVFDVFLPEGRVNIDLDMKIPMIEAAKIQFEGVAHLDNARLSVLSLDLPVTDIKGVLNFNEQGIYSEGIAARALGYPIEASIVNEPTQTRLKVTGVTDIDSLKAQFPSLWWNVASGKSAYSLMMNIPVAEDAAASLLLTSDFQGVELGLPESLAKSKLQSRPFYLHFDFTDSKRLPATLNYDNILQVEFLIDKERRNLYAADILYGKGGAERFTQPGIRLTVNQENFSLQPWLDFNNLHKEAPRTEAVEMKGVHINTRHFIWQKKDLGAMVLQLKKMNQQWQGGIKTHMAAGKLNLPANFNAKSRMDLDMQYLDLSALSDLSLQGESLSPTDFPAVNLNSSKLFWRSTDLGRLVLETKPASDGFSFRRFEIMADDWSLSARGRCWTEGGTVVTETKGKFTAASLGDFLTRLDLNHELKGAAADIDFSLQWPGAPYQFSLAEINGDLKVKLEQGRLLGIEPGLGRILGAFDLAQWKRRVHMDFSDVYSKGLAFNGIKGNFYLTDGYADTNDLVIDAVAAKFEIRGQTGLVDRKYNQEIIVTPKSSAVIPFAGTIAGYMVKKLTGTHPDSLTRSYYSLKGTWDKPELKKRRRKKVR